MFSYVYIHVCVNSSVNVAMPTSSFERATTVITSDNYQFSEADKR